MATAGRLGRARIGNLRLGAGSRFGSSNSAHLFPPAATASAAAQPSTIVHATIAAVVAAASAAGINPQLSGVAITVPVAAASAATLASVQLTDKTIEPNPAAATAQFEVPVTVNSILNVNVFPTPAAASASGQPSIFILDDTVSCVVAAATAAVVLAAHPDTGAVFTVLTARGLRDLLVSYA